MSGDPQRRKFLRHAGLAGILAAGAAPAAHAQQAIRWRLVSAFPKALDTIHGAAETFSRKVREMSGGRFEISVHAAGELMPASGVLDGVRRGSVECAHAAACHFHDKDESFSIDCAIPFGLNSRQMTAWMYQGNGMKLLREFYAQYNVVNFPMGNTGAQMGGWYRKEIKSLQDMKGLRMRVSGLAAAVMTKLGAVSRPLPDGEVYAALEKGTIDSAEWIGPHDDRNHDFHKVARFYAYPAWWKGGAQFSLLVNRRAHGALTAENRAILECAAALAHADMQAKYDVKNPQALGELVASGAKLFRMPKPVMDAAFKAAEAEYAALSAKNPDWKKIYADYAAFRREQNQWFRYAEASFDSYMQARKL